MSFITSTIKCQECGKEINVAFGIVGETQIASWPKECPKCKSTALKRISEGWNAKEEVDCPIHKNGGSICICDNPESQTDQSNG